MWYLYFNHTVLLSFSYRYLRRHLIRGMAIEMSLSIFLALAVGGVIHCSVFPLHLRLRHKAKL